MISGLNHRQFVSAWVDAYNRKEGVPGVARRADITIAAASARANYLRKLGVELPKMPKARYTVSVEDLNELIEQKIAQ